jgi:hypothetical protein
MRSHAVILASALAWLIGIQGADAKLDILVDKATQRMLVIQDGYIRYMWPVSTGRDNMATPNGSYTPQRLERNWFSKAYYDSPMPFSIFFHNGYAIHGSYAIDRLGGPASHGCVRLHPHHAAILFDLVQQEGPDKTSIEITDDGRPPEGQAMAGRESVLLRGTNPPGLPSPDTVGMGPGANPPVPPRDIVGAAPPGLNPQLPRRVRFREGVDTPELPPALRSSQPMATKMGLPPPPVPRPAPPRRMLANARPPASFAAAPGAAGQTATAIGAPRLPNEASEPRSKPKAIEAPKVIEAPKIADGSSQPASSSSGIKLLPASCWSGGASRWQWWASRDGSRCK